MSQTILQRGSVFAIKKEAIVGEFENPTSGNDFIPLRTGFAMELTVEELASEELVNDIGSAKSQAGKESVAGTHGSYIKHSEVEGQEPETGLLYESCLGAKTVNATEYDTIGGSTVAKVVVDSGEGVNFEHGQALLIKDPVNGYSIRNVDSISSDDLNLNFNLSNAPGSGVNLGKAVLYKPATSGHPSFTAWLYNGNGGAKQVAAGCRTSGLTITANSGQQAEIEFSYEGAKYLFNPIEIGATNKYLDFTDDAGTFAAVVDEQFYHNPIELAEAIQNAMNGVSTETYSVAYSSANGKFTISTSTSSLLSLLWDTGANTANTIGASIGFSVAADDTGSLSYLSDNAQDLTAPYTPVFDDSTNIIVKDAELFIGSKEDNICKCARTVTVAISTPTEDVDCICEKSGVKEKIILSREVTMTAELLLSKYETQLFDKLKQNKDVSAMLNLGPKSGGDWVPGKCVNINMPKATVTGHTVTGDDFVLVNVTLKGFVTSDKKDCQINFI